MAQRKDESIRSVKSTKSVKSVRSLKSQKSLKTVPSPLSDYGTVVLPSFEDTLQLTVQKYCCPFSVYVKREYQQDDFYKQLKVKEKPVRYKKITVTVPATPQSTSTAQIEEKTIESDITIDEDTVVMTSVYDNVHNLTEIILNKVRKPVPRALVQILGYLAPTYEYLYKIKILSCIIDSTILYELCKIMNTTYITDICLDGSRVPEGCYFTLLDSRESRIKNLSLCRCKINDEACKEIATRLKFLCPGEKTLLLLNLSSNHITDEGAKHIGEGLRTNRRLRYLNLADNRIGDEGAAYILDSLKDFPLTNVENTDRKYRKFDYTGWRKSTGTKENTFIYFI